MFGEKIVLLPLFFCLISSTRFGDMRQKSFLALGDSYTIGESVSESERWPVVLVARLREQGIEIADPVIIAKSGWTTDELDNAIDEKDPQGTFDFVTLLIGVNNQYRGRSSDEYRKEFTSLLQRAVTYAEGKPAHVIVISIPDWGVMPFAEGRDRNAISHEIDAFNAVNWQEAVRAGVHYIDITPISRQVDRYPELIAMDGLHPSARQYAFWVDLIEPKALNVLQKNVQKEKE